MTSEETRERQDKARELKAIQTDTGAFFVESSEGKIMYRVIFKDDEIGCTCGDFSRNIKRDADFKCKHLFAVMNAIPLKQVEEVRYLEKRKPKLDERFVTKIEGRDFVKYAGLLDLGHQKGISSIDVEILQIPSKENHDFAICRARVISSCGEEFSDIGDANPSNCNSKVARHLLRLSSTRAIARALRSYTNVGMTSLEELGDLEDVVGQPTNPKPNRPPAKSRPAPAKAKPKKETKPKGNGKSDNGNQTPKTGSKADNGDNTMSEPQKRAIYNLSRRRGISTEDLETMAFETFGTGVESLSAQDASALIRQLQQAA